MGEAVSDGIKSLKESEEGHGFVRALSGDLRKVFFFNICTPNIFCALDLNVIPARDWSTTSATPGNSPRRRRGSRERNAQNFPVQTFDKRGREVHGFFDTHKARVAHDVHALFLVACMD